MFWMSKKTKLRPILEKIQCFSTTCVLTPGYFIFQMTVMRPQTVDILNMAPLTHFFHILLSTYFFINVAGNMMLSMMIDTTLKRYHGEGIYCETCKQNRPLKTWHCETCNACVVRRDHHCTFLSKCIGRYNQRYFLCLLAHLTISLVYASYYNFFVIAYQYDAMDFTLASAKIFNPVFRWFASEPMELRELYILFWYVNLLMLLVTGVLLYLHLSNVLNGVTWYEAKNKKVAKTHWLNNIRYVFGTKWYLAVLWPFVDSPLP